MALDDDTQAPSDPQGIVDSLMSRYGGSMSAGMDPQAIQDRLIQKTWPTLPASLGKKGPLETPAAPQPPADQNLDFSGQADPIQPKDFEQPDFSSQSDPISAENVSRGAGIGITNGSISLGSETAETLGQSLGRAPAEIVGSAIKSAGELTNKSDTVRPYYDTYANWDKLTKDQQNQARNKVHFDDDLSVLDKTNILTAFNERAKGTPAKTLDEFAPPPGKGGLEQFGETVKGLGAKAFPLPEGALERHPTAAAIGSGLGAILTGGLTGNVVAGAGLLGLSSAAATFDKGIADGATPEQAASASGLTGAVNTVAGALPIGVVLQPLVRASPGLMGWATALLTRAINDGIVFTGIGEAQEYVAAQIASHYYDPEVAKKSEYKEDLNRVVGEFATGGIAGIFSGLIHPGPTAVEDFLKKAKDGPVPPPSGTPGGPDRGAAWRADIDDFLRQRAAREQAANPAALGTPQLGRPPGATPPPPPPGAAPGGAAPPPGAEPPPTPPRGGAGAVPDVEILRRAGHSDEDILNLMKDPVEMATAVDEAIQNGVSVGPEPQKEAPKPGTQQAPVEATTGADVKAAADVANKEHTGPQGEANNVQRGHLEMPRSAGWDGMGITIEAGPFEMRRGLKPDGTTFETRIGPAAYGYWKGLPKAADQQDPDVFVGQHPTAPNAYVIDEVDPRTGAYRQSKSFVGFRTPQEAFNAYLQTSTKSPDSIGGTKAYTIPDFVQMARAGGLSHPVSDRMLEAQARGLEAGGVTGFQTAKGSTYEVHPDGTTTRTKAARSDHPGDSGLKPRSARTVYVDPQVANALAAPQSVSWRYIDGGSTLSLAWHHQGRWGITKGQRGLPYQMVPKVGLVPVELWNKEQIYGKDAFSGVHFGNEITNVSSSKGQEGTGQASQEGGPQAAEPQQPLGGAKERPGAQEPGRGQKEREPVELKNVQPWLDEGIKAQWQLGKQLGVIDDIEHLAAERKTAQEIVKILGPRLDRVGELAKLNGEAGFEHNNKLAFVRAIRVGLGIPSQEGDAAEFEQWRANYFKSIANEPARHDHVKPVEDAIAATGDKPEEMRPADIQTAAEVHAEGVPAADAWPIGVVRNLVNDGHIAEESVNAAFPDKKDQAEIVLGTGKQPAHELPAEAPSAGPGGEATAQPGEQRPVSAEDEQKAGGESEQAAEPGKTAEQPAGPEAAPHGELPTEGGSRAERPEPGAGTGKEPQPADEQRPAPGGEPSAGAKPAVAEGHAQPANRPGAKPAKRGAAKGEAAAAPERLADLGPEPINGYGEGEGNSSPRKAQFLRDARDYLKGISRALQAEGWEQQPSDRIARGGKQKLRDDVFVNPSGPAVSGDVSMILRKGDTNVYVDIGAHHIQNVPSRPNGTHIMLRFGQGNDIFGTKGQNQWLDPDMTSGDLLDLIRKRTAHTAEVKPPEEAEEAKAPEPADERDEFDKAFDEALAKERAEMEAEEAEAAAAPTPAAEGLAEADVRRIAKAQGIEVKQPKKGGGYTVVLKGRGSEYHANSWASALEHLESMFGAPPEKAPETPKVDANEAWYDGLSSDERSQLIERAGRQDLASTYKDVAWQDLSDNLRNRILAEAGRARTPAPKKPVTPQVPPPIPDARLMQRAGHWWNDELTAAGRADVLKGLGLKRSSKTRFWNLSAEDQERIASQMPPPEAPQTSPPRQPTMGDSAISAAKNAIDAADDAMSALTALFGGPKVSMGFTFDDDTYAQAKPLFERAAMRFKDAFHDVALMVSQMVSHLRKHFKWTLEMIDQARPYLRKFIEEVRAGAIRLGEPQIKPEETTGAGPGQRPPRGLGEEGEPQTQPEVGPGEPPGEGGVGPLEGEAAADGGGPGEAPGAGGDGTRPGGPVSTGGAGVPESGDASTGRAGAGGDGVATERPGERPPEPSLRPNYHLVDPERLVGGGPKARFARNKAALTAFRNIQAEDRDPTNQELDEMASYIGWGSFGQELFNGTWERGRPKEGWKDENQWLRDHMGKEEWESAQGSIINAHYTDPPTVSAVWNLARAMGFDGGRVLEPSMGIGNFFGLMPRDMMHGSNLTGIELDRLTGGMAKLLYPQANVRIMPYQDSKAADGFYDLIVGNWPFSAQAPADRRYNTLNATLHDFFFAKAIDQVRPGGLVMGITSAGTMDKVGKPVRIYLAKRAELVAAFRFPTGAFRQYAGTDVVTDLLILRKRDQALPTAEGSGWLESVKRNVPGGEVRVNEYWAQHPDHILGELAFGDKTTIGRPGMMVNRPADFEQRLAELPSKVPNDGYRKITRGNEPRFESNNTADRQGAVTNKAGKLFVVTGEHLAPLEDVYNYKTGTKAQIANKETQLHALVEMRRAYGALLDGEREGEINVPDLRKALQAQYLDFRKAHGPIKGSLGLGILKRVKDPFAHTLEALETPSGAPAKILFESTIRGKKRLEQPNVRDAFVLQRNQSTRLDLDTIAESVGRPREDVIKELEGQNAIYRLPNGVYEPSDVFLSGNVRKKLREAVAARKAGDHLMERSIEALKKVVPNDMPYYKIEARLGAPWVPELEYRRWIAEILGVPLDEAVKPDESPIRVAYRAQRWKVGLSHALTDRDEARVQWGDPDVRFDKMLMAAMGNTTVKVWGRDEEGNAIVLPTRTAEANEKITRLREEFARWVWRDPERRVRLEHAYNDVMRAIATPQFDGSFLEFPGMALQRGDQPFNMRKHQIDAAWRGIVNRAGLYAHEVGTGKTYTMGAIAVESRRYGIARKPMIFAHNANSASVASEIQEQYPGAKILYVDNLAKDQVKTTMARIANDDWDAIVVPHSMIDRFGLSEATMNGLAAEQIAAIEQEAMEAAAEDGATIDASMMDDEDAMKKVRSPTAKQLVNQRNKIKEQIKKLAQRASKEDAITFENLGVDMIMVDEAHVFKKPPISTRMKLRGLNTEVSSRSIALRFLTDYIKSINGGRGVHLFTGTPITNTLSEIFHQMRYVMDDVMKQDGIQDWDPWFNTFAEAETDVELSSTGGYEPVTRLQSFVNTGELRQMLGQFMDVVFADEMPEFTPRSINGKTMASPDLTEAERNHLMNGRTEDPVGRPYKQIVNDMGQLSPRQQNQLNHLNELALRFKSWGPKDRRDAMLRGDEEVPLRVDSNAAKAGLDERLYELDAPGHPDAKVERAIRNVLKLYKDSDKASQAVFVDQGYNDFTERVIPGQIGVRNKRTYKAPTFNLVKYMIDKLVEGGIPRDEIAIIDGSVSKLKRKQIADDMNTLRKRVVIGNRDAMGVGVNMQKYLRAMHHLDAPWMPGQLEQSNGRGWRQGNTWNTVLEFRYITEKLDGRRWQVLAKKDKFIKDFLHADENARIISGDAADDAESESISDIMQTLSEAAGDPRVLVKRKLEAQISKLQDRERLHTFGIHDAIQRIDGLRGEIESAQRWIVNLDADIGDFKRAIQEGFKAKIVLPGDKGAAEFTDQAAADKALGDMVATLKKGEKQQLGTVYGHKIKADWSAGWMSEPDYRMGLQAGEFQIRPTIASIDAVIRALPGRVQRSQQDIADKTGTIERLHESTKEQFPQQKLLDDKKRQLAELEADMAGSPAVPPGWLRQGAAVDTDVYARTPEGLDRRAVTGHRWGDDDYYVLTDKGEMPYRTVLDDQGLNVYEPHPFEKPVQQQTAQAQNVPPRTPPRGRGPRSALYDDQASTISQVLADAGVPFQASERIKQQITQEIARATGGRANVSFESTIPLDERFEEALRQHGVTADLKGKTAGGVTYYGRSLGEALIEIALNDPKYRDPLGTAYHELDHLAERYLFTDEENALRQRETPRMREWLREHGRNPDKLADKEVRAEATRLYIESMNEGTDPGRGLHFMVRKMLAKLWSLIRRLRVTFQRQGYQTWQDIVEALHRGEMAERPAREPPRQEIVPQPEAKPAEARAEPTTAQIDASLSIVTDAVGAAYGKVHDKVEQLLGHERMLDVKEGIKDYNYRVRELRNMIEALYRRWVDADGNLPDDKDFYTLKRLLPGKMTAMLGSFEHEYRRPIAEHLGRNGINPKDAGDYLWAKHAMERNVEISRLYANDPTSAFHQAAFDVDAVGGSGLSARQARTMINDFEGRPNGPAFRQLSEMNKNMVAFGRRLMVDYGLESQDTVDKWASTYPNYVDLSGFDDPDKEPDEPPRGTGGDVRGGTKRALGRRSKSANPLANTMLGVVRTIERGERNMVLNALADAIAGLPRDVRNSIAKFNKGRPVRKIDRNTGFVRWTSDFADKYSPRAVHYRRDGQSRYLVMEDWRTAGSIKRWSAMELWPVIAWMTKATNMAKATWTHYSPDFIIARHQVRYWGEGILNSFDMMGRGGYGLRNVAEYGKTSFPIIGDGARAIFARERGEPAGPLGDLYDRMKAQGGTMGIRQMRDFDTVMKDMEKSIKDIGRSKANPLRAWRSFIRWADHWSNTMDSADRLARFSQEVKNGRSDQQAALAARDATIDYALRGYWAPVAGFFEPMANTAVQTGFRLKDAMQRSKYSRRLWLGIFGSALGLAAWNYFIGGKDKDGVSFYDKLPEWDRLHNLIIFNPWTKDAEGRPEPVKIPFPYNWAWPAAWATAMGGLMWGSKPTSEYASFAFKAMMSVFSTIEEGAGFGMRTFVPEIVKPAVDIWVNKKWTGAPVHIDPGRQHGPNAESPRRGFEDKAPLNVAWEEAAHWLNIISGGNASKSGYMDFHPEDLQTLFDPYIGTYERLIDNTVQAGKAVGGLQAPAPNNIPIGRVFYGTDYDAADRVNAAKERDINKHPWLR
jgi:N12 class adenine-specific DNA methylase